MVVERDERWVPEFPPNPRRVGGPSSSAPTGRSGGGGSVTPSSPKSSDDDASSASNITNRCSPKAVFNLVSKLSEFKKEIIREIGFGGILDIPCISKLNLKLSAWLLSKMDCEESCLVFGPSRRIYVHEADVGIVLGVPSGDIDVSTLSVTDEQLELLRSSIGLVGSDPRSVKGIEYVLQKHLDDQSSSQEIDSFKVAFVVFAINHLLAPCVKHDQVNLDFWGALKNPAALDRCNWCRYVYGHVLDAAQKVRGEMISKGRATSLSGCHYFLQILFLDNVDLSRLNKPHKTIPRLKVFDQESLRVMAVMCASRGEHDFEHFIGIRCAESSVYLRHTYQSPHIVSPVQPPQGRAMVPNIRMNQQISIGADHPVSVDSFSFKSPTDFSSYLRQRHPGLEKSYFIDYIKNHNAFMMRELFNLRSSIMRSNALLVDWLVDQCGPTQVQLMHKKPGPAAHVKPDAYLSTMSSQRARGVAPKFCALPTKRSISVSDAESTPVKKLKSASDVGADPPSFDLGIEASPAGTNEVTPKDKIFAVQRIFSPNQQDPSKPQSSRRSCGVAEMSPYDASRHLAQCIILDIVHVIEESIDPTDKVLYGQWITQPYVKLAAPATTSPSVDWASDLLPAMPDPVVVGAIIECCNELSETPVRREWVVHDMPRYLVLTGAELINSFVQGKGFDSDSIDVAFRRFRQLDPTIQTDGLRVRWRHFIESDFAMNSLAGYGPERIITVFNQFTNVDYCIPTCKLIVVPVLVDHVWCAYMFDMQRSVLHVLDPALGVDRTLTHKEIHITLHVAFQKCLESFYEGWSIQPFENWKLQYPMLSAADISSDDFGIVMLHSARCFDGVQMHQPVQKDNIDSIRHSIFVDILMMEQNKACLPKSLSNCLPK